MPDVATNEVSTYTLVYEISVLRRGKLTRRLLRIYSDDYVGQNWVQGALNGRVKERQKSVSSSTLVIVVDLIVPGTKLEPVQRQEKAQRSRIRDQLRIYNDPAIQTLGELLGTNGQIVLFINKIDLIYPPTDERVKEAVDSYAFLVERLSEIRGVGVHVIVGSATTGLGVVGFDEGQDDRRNLLKLVIDHAEKIDINKMKVVPDGTKS
jgi:hypothetical protein